MYGYDRFYVRGLFRLHDLAYGTRQIIPTHTVTSGSCMLPTSNTSNIQVIVYCGLVQIHSFQTSTPHSIQSNIDKKSFYLLNLFI